jgi:uncharacterized RmlC-like cupin family protein
VEIERHNGYAIVRASQATVSKQGLTNFVGLSGENVGATGLCMNVVVIPAGKSAEPHCHQSETAIYMLKGKVVTKFGEGLAEEAEVEEGNFLYIGSMTWHQPINPTTTDAVAIVARNDPYEQENVILYNQVHKTPTV